MVLEHSWFILQHPFIRDACDRKPLLDLLAEFKAEIINEEEMDIEEEVRKGSTWPDQLTLVDFLIPQLAHNLIDIQTWHQCYILSKTYKTHTIYYLLGQISTRVHLRRPLSYVY